MKSEPFYALLLTLLIVSQSAECHTFPNDTIPAGRKISITGVGDIMFGTSFPSPKYLPPHDNPLILLGTLADTLASADIAFGNLEGSFLDDGEPVKKCKDSTKCYLFRMPERYASALATAGLDMISLANNHFGDFGPTARKRTMQLLDSMGIIYGGLTEHPFSILRKDSILYGFCAFAPNAGTVSIHDLAEAETIVKYLADTCDIVIVSFHGGAEGSDYQRVPEEEEMMFTENRGDIRKFSHTVIDAGADVVFGHGPHVTRAVEVYRERFIAYSLGNFCTYGRFNLQGPNGIAPVIRLDTDISGKFIAGKIIPVYQMPGSGVRPDPDRRVIRKIRELTALDFPGSVILISEDGKITYK